MVKLSYTEKARDLVLQGCCVYRIIIKSDSCFMIGAVLNASHLEIMNAAYSKTSRTCASKFQFNEYIYI